MLQQVLNTLMHEDFRYFGIARSVTTGTSRRYVAMHEGVKCEKGRGEDEDEWRRQFVYDLAILVAKES